MEKAVVEPRALHDVSLFAGIDYDCRVISTKAQLDVAQRIAQNISKFSKCGIVDPKSLDKIAVRSGAELGMFIVIIDGASQLSVLESRINRIRNEGGFVGVLGILVSCSSAASLTGEPFLDHLICLEWAGAEAMIGEFIKNHRARIQNRAFRAYLDHSSDGYWIWNVEEDGIEWSERTREMTGVSASEEPRTLKELSELIHPLDRDRVKQAIENHLHKSAPYKNIEMRLRRSDGRHGHFLANGQALRNEKGEAIILVGSLTDRTLMQRVEQQLEDTQKRFTVLFHHMNDAAMLADIETGIILEANQPAERLWGKSIAELVGCHQSQLHPPVLTDVAKKAFRDHIAALMTNKRDTIHVPILRADGTELPAEISSSLIDIDGKVMILGVFRDISDRVKAERELRERDAQLQLSSHLASMGTLAAGVAHEINNPLTYMLGNLELLRENLADIGVEDGVVNEAIEAAWTGGRYVREIVSDLKAITKMDSVADHCDPCEVIRIASRMALADLRHRARLDLKLSDVTEVQLSSARLSQVVLNILSNAVHAFQDGDQASNRISVEAYERRDRVTIVIEDNGMGISAEDLSHVSEPFFTRRGEKGGTGLGLSICRRIVTEAGGELKINSKLGHGTKVTVTLPSASKEDQSLHGAAANSEIALEGRKRVIVIDDEPLITSLLDRILRRHFKVVIFNNARMALKCIEEGAEFDLALCDIMMPEMDGPRLYEAAGHRLPFLFLTGGAVTGKNMAFASRMASEGRLIYKPFESAQLVRAIKQVLLNGKLKADGQTARDSSAKKAQPVKASRNVTKPDLIFNADLIDVLGRDTLKAYCETLGAHLADLCSESAGLPLDDLAKVAHRIAGAAAILGVMPLADLLKGIQDAADEGDADRAAQLLEQVCALQSDLSVLIEAV